MKRNLGLGGAILLILGVFLPIMSAPIVGTINYIHNGRGDGLIVLALAVVSLILVFAKQYKALWATGGISFAIMLYTVVNFQMKISQMKASMESELSGNPFRGLADLAVNAVKLQWGWAILFCGAMLILASAGVKEEAPTT